MILKIPSWKAGHKGYVNGDVEPLQPVTTRTNNGTTNNNNNQ